MPSDLLIKCQELLKQKELTLSTAESATAGRLCAELSLIPKCGNILKGGIVCYDAGIKQELLNVPKELVDRYTPESAEVTAAIASGLSSIMSADIQVGITGLTMPGGSETEEKPVGTMFIHAIIKGEHVAVRKVYQGDSESIVMQTIDTVAETIIKHLSA